MKRFLLLIGVVCAAMSLAQAQTTYYVTTIGNDANAGTAWGTAFRTIQQALSVATSGDEIWVAAGNYFPDEGPGQTDNSAFSTFQLVDGVALYGGFNGTEATLADRPFPLAQTVLSGDLRQDDSPQPIISTDASMKFNPTQNAYHVVYVFGLTTPTIIDGFVITAGEAVSFITSGGGMQIDDDSPITVSNCVFLGNKATDTGGGIYNLSSFLTLSNCEFSGNLANNGGGMFNFGDGITITGCTFSNNTANSIGGGMYNTFGSPVLTDCTFSDNEADTGGGMYVDSSSPSISGCTFSGNTATHGGGMYNENGSSPIISNCTFSNNTAVLDGGGMSNSSGSPVVTNSIFIGNTGNNSGGGMSNFFVTMNITNCVFSGNKGGKGGGMNNFQSSLNIYNCTITGNTTNIGGGGGNGGGINNEQSSPIITNCIIWNNLAGDPSGEAISNDFGSNPTISNTIIPFGCAWSTDLGTDGGNNIGLDPQFITPVDPATAPTTTTGNLRLMASSPAINRGDNSIVTVPPFQDDGLSNPIDLDANARIQVATVDMGAYEENTGAMTNPIVVSPIIYVDADANPGGNGSSWATAYNSLTDAVEEACACGDKEIWVANGIYYPTQNFDGNSFGLTDPSNTFKLCNTVAIYGGFSGWSGGSSGGSDETMLSQRNIATNVTILSGDLQQDDSQQPIVTDPTTNANNFDNAYSVVTGSNTDNTAVLDGFTITAGNNFNFFNTGGGISIENGSPIIRNNHITGNNTSSNGGGMANALGAAPTIINNNFTNNNASGHGGGIYNGGASATITDNTFTGNNANTYGGAIMNENATNVIITNANITDNSAFDGGGVYNFQSTSTVTNSTFAGNNASRWGGGMHNSFSSSPDITNTVFSGNAATESGGGIYNTSSSSPTIINSTISGNLAGDFGGGIYNETSSNPTITNSIIWNNQADGVITSTNAAIYNNSATPTIANSILYFNCDWDNALGTNGGNNKSVNPQFITSIDPATAPTTTGDFRLQPTSPAINMGDNSVVTIPPFLDDGMSNAIDLDNNTRIQLSTVDIGAFEENTGGTGSVVAVSSIIYVDTDAAPGGDGSSWAMAYNNLQDALKEACLCGNKEIWVADGIYYPTQNSAGTSTGPTDRTNTFQLCNTVEIYGGFSGWSGGTSGGSDETMLSQRDVVANVTVLSGDIDQDDVAFDPLVDSDSDGNSPTQTDHLRGNNAYTVVTGSGTDATAILDGFTVTGGASNFSFSDVASGAGGGMINDGGSPTIRNNTFSGNYADNFGGGMYNLNSSAPEITNCNFIGNNAVTGGGMHNRFNSNPTITNCTFEYNNAFNNGGGLVNDDASPTITNSRFLNNTASTGGGIANFSGASPNITNCVFSGNNVFFNGGGMLNSLSSPTIINCVFSGNNAGVHGGGISNEANSSPQIINTTLSGNNADGVGGGIYNQSNSNPSIINSIIWNNQANGQINTTRASIAIDDTNTSTATISYSIIPFNCVWDTELGIDGGNNKSVNPKFVTPVDPTTAPTTAGDLHLLPASSAINMGDNSVVTAPPFPDDGSSNPVDLDGNARIQVSTVDIGAYEENTGSTGTPVPPLPSNYFVDADAPPGGDGLSWATAFDNLQDALSAACGCGTIDIWVADGTYYPDEGTEQLDNNSNSTFTLCNNVGIYGGFSGWSGGTSGGSDETLLSQRDFVNNVTILNGDLMQNDAANIPVDQLGVEASRSDNALHVITASNTDNTAILDGFTIANGNASGGSFVLGTGGGIFMENADPQIRNNILIHNSATFAAGGMYNSASAPTIVNTNFTENYSRSSGGGMYNSDSSSPTITDCDFTGNGAFSNGGAIYNVNSSSMMISGSTFTDNTAGTSGGGLYSQQSGMVTIENCTFTGNTATSSDAGAIFNSLGNMSLHDTEFTSNSSPGAGAISHSSSMLTITNCRFISNTSTGSGGAIRNIDASPEITNSIFKGNSADGNGGVMFNQSSASPTIINCIFTGNNTPADGGVMYNDFNSSPTIINSTFTGNSARSGGVLFNTRNSSPVVTNSIIWNNQALGIIDNSNASIFNSSSSPTISYTLIPYGCTWDVALGIDGGNNINADPQFITPVDPTTAPTISGDVHLMPTSPAIERGDNSVVTVPPFPEDGMSNPIDLDGNARIQVATVDMGAYEENTGATINPVASVPAPVIDAVTPATCDAPGEISFAGTLGANEAYFVSTDGVNFFELMTATIPIPAGQATAVAYQIKTVNTVIGCESEVVTINVDPVVYYTITTTGGNLVITDNCNNGETLTLSENAGNIRIENFNPTRTYQIDGGAITAFSTPAEVPLAGLTSITVNAAGGDDIINLGAFSANLPGLTLNGGTGNDQINFNGDITFATNANLDVDLQNDDATPGADQVTLAANVNILTQGTGTITVKVSQDIELATGSSLQTTDGAITLEANQQAVSTNEAFTGITIQGTVGSVGTGAVTLMGKAGSAGNNTNGVRINGANAKVISAGGDVTVIGQGNSDNSFGVTLNYGVYLLNGGQIMAGGMGTVTVEGTGGPFGSSNEFGVVISGTGSRINSSGGNVKVTGQGGGSSTAGFSGGVFVGGIITAGGTGMVTVEGTGGPGTGGDNIGIEVRGPDGQITSSGGDVMVTGQGVFLSSGGVITAGGMGMVTVEGTGGANDGFSNHGVEVSIGSSQITSSGGDVLIKGFGGGSGTSFGNNGIIVGTTITAGGNGTVTVEGTGGDGSAGFHMGVTVNGQITSSGGNVMVTGQGGGSGSATDNYGIAVFGGEITAGGNGTVKVEGTGGMTEGDNNYGVNLQNSGSLITSSGGDVLVKGFGGGSGASANNWGISLFQFGTITAGETGKVTVEGTGGATEGNENIGVYLFQPTSLITSSGGDVMVTGQGGGNGASGSNVGVQLGSYTLFVQGGTITAGGNGSVMVTGTGGSSEGDKNDGVAVLYTNSTITSSGGAVSVNGTGGGSSNSNNNFGVNVTAGGKITAGLAGAVNVDGTGGSTAGMNNYGVFVGEFFNSQISSTDGPIYVIGQGGNGAPDILLENSGKITTPSATAGITMESKTNGTYPHTSGTDVSATATQKTAFANDSKLNIDIDALFQYQVLGVVGMIDLTGAILTFNGSTHTPAVGNTFLIVNNDGTDPVIGTFQGLPEGGTIPNFLGSGLFAQITYVGGDGNDVVLSIVENVVVTCTVPVPQLTPATCDAPGQIAFTSTLGTNEAYFVSTDGGSAFEELMTATIPLPQGPAAAASYQIKTVNSVDGCESEVITVNVEAVVCGPPPCPTGTNVIVYVDQSNPTPGYGSSWATAFNKLQDALDFACNCPDVTQIWVAKGIYYPDEGASQVNNDRNSTFQLCNNLALYGGFVGTEPSNYDLSLRDLVTNETILSGDLLQDDSQQPIVTDPSTNTSNTDNAYTVVTGSGTNSTAIIDGFTITAGHADVSTILSNPTREGAGMYNDNGSPTIAHCTFTGNLAISNGGGISNINSSPSITDCIFSNNIATENSGGGIANFEGSLVVTNCMFLNNRAGTTGGGIESGRCTLVVTDCTFSGNISGFNGGAIYQTEASIDVLNCTFEENVADNVGGGIFNSSNSSPSSFINCTFIGNMVQGGGGLHVEFSSSTTTVANCIFTGNEATDIGGALTIAYNTLDILNCTFSGNKAANRGGAIFNAISSTNITNSIIWNNQAGGIIDDANATIFNLAGGNALISYTILPFDCLWDPALGINGGNNNSIDPEFITPVDPATAPTTAGNVRLMPTSPAINRGDNSVVTVPPFPEDGMSNPIDLDGIARIQVSTVDRGAYEENTGATINPIVSPIPATPIVNIKPATCDAPGQIAFTSSLGTNEAYFVSTDGGNNFEELMTATIPLPQGPTAAVTYQIKTVNSVTGCESEVVTVPVVAVECVEPCDADAGNDNSTTACVGDIINLTMLVSVTGGSFEDPEATGGLNGSNFNTTGLEPGAYVINYIVDGGIDCPDDMAEITINVQALPNVTFMTPDPITLQGGVQILGGGMPLGGMYSGDGVTDNNNGQTFTFDPSVNGAGSTTVTYTYTTPAGWNQVGEELTGNVSSSFGQAVATSADGSRIIIGAPTDNTTVSGAGKAQVYEWSGNTWVQLGADLTGSNANQLLGIAVAMTPDGNRIAIGSLFSGVEVYDWNGANWMPVGGAFGGGAKSISFSADGNRVAIGTDISSTARIYDWKGANWVQAGSTLAGDRSGDGFGTSVSLSADGSILAVGATEGSSFLSSPISGYVKIFVWDGGAWGQQGQTLMGDADGDSFGSSVDVSAAGTRVVVGSINYARVYDWNGSMWVQAGNDITAPSFNSPISISGLGNRLAVRNVLYNWNGTDWVLDENISYSGSEIEPAISGDGNRILFGNGFGDDARVYERGIGCTNTATAEVVVNDAPPCTAPEVTIEGSATICTTKKLPLADLKAKITYDGEASELQYTWSIKEDGENGTLSETDTSNPNAGFYMPGKAAIERGSVTLVLTVINPNDECEGDSAEVVIKVLKVDCGNFPWSGNKKN